MGWIRDVRVSVTPVVKKVTESGGRRSRRITTYEADDNLAYEIRSLGTPNLSKSRASGIESQRAGGLIDQYGVNFKVVKVGSQTPNHAEISFYNLPDDTIRELDSYIAPITIDKGNQKGRAVGSISKAPEGFARISISAGHAYNAPNQFQFRGRYALALFEGRFVTFTYKNVLRYGISVSSIEGIVLNGMQAKYGIQGSYPDNNTFTIGRGHTGTGQEGVYFIEKGTLPNNLFSPLEDSGTTRNFIAREALDSAIDSEGNAVDRHRYSYLTNDGLSTLKQNATFLLPEVYKRGVPGHRLINLLPSGKPDEEELASIERAKDDRLELSALIHRGTMWRVYTERVNNGTDTLTTIFSRDLFWLTDDSIDLKIPRGLTYREVLERILDEFRQRAIMEGQDFVNWYVNAENQLLQRRIKKETVLPKFRGFREAELLAFHLGLSFNVQDGIIYIEDYRRSQYRDSLPEISIDSGLLKQPKLTDKGIEVEMLLDPRIRVGSLVYLRETNIVRIGGVTPLAPQVNSQNFRTVLSNDRIYRVASLKHFGQTRGTTYRTKAFLLNSDDRGYRSRSELGVTLGAGL